MSKRSSILKNLGLIQRNSNDGGDNVAPPAYNAVSSPYDGHVANGRTPATEAEIDNSNVNVNLAQAFENLRLDNSPSNPSIATCLAHLKLLFAIQSLKEYVGYTDGLFGLWDARVGPLDHLTTPPVNEKTGSPEETPTQKEVRDKTLAALSKIREKRWALFVAKAVDRYEAWWKSLPDGRPHVTHTGMSTPQSPFYEAFSNRPESLMTWKEDMLPPLDVLMVWHTHMLNPWAFLEDSMLAGYRSLWTTGVPWALVNNAIDSNFNYHVSDHTKNTWTSLTGFQWEPDRDFLAKKLKCPRCDTSVDIPWTTCSLPEDYIPQNDQDGSLIGNGYGDGNLQHPCPSCGVVFNKELLSVAKFVHDTKLLLSKDRPMPGTLLYPKTGAPGRHTLPAGSARVKALECMQWPHAFPNRLLKSGCNSIRSRITEMITSYRIPQPTMEDVKREIEMVISSRSNIKQIEGLQGYGLGNLQQPAYSRLVIRKMMSRYWENFGMFALDLAGAVMRQGVFVEKMVKLDWLHSPSAEDTVNRCIKKYLRFFNIMAANPGQVTVPTLDVDLAWHTHQLSPSSYFAYSWSKTGKFVDHDDKIPEDTLSLQFEWTSKVYQELYGEVYSECTCWYCEAIRSSHVSSLGKVLGLSRQERVAEDFHKAGTASLCPPDKSAHISSHNSVRSIPVENVLAIDSAARTRRHVQARLEALNKKRLEAAYLKAKANAEKKGRKPPTREQYYDHWGYAVPYGAPYMYPVWYTPGLYYGWYPVGVAACGGGAGGCVPGTCGGGVAAGACGGAGGCGGGGDGGAGCASGGGGCGGSGGGGAGGCGGGGGGGGGCGGGGGS
ncbi:hypothetical protein QBC35DRAFT_147343 [Podospora australis]|uniref:Glycine-rich domain-containing protein 1 n=2 Tax=Opisthokonta TaxID=33154 RepID=A0AAN6WJQ9_9PEZI|nr:hypothetical protein QBC35DRAFT_147343 [Podospora australis]